MYGDRQKYFLFQRYGRLRLSISSNNNELHYTFQTSFQHILLLSSLLINEEPDKNSCRKFGGRITVWLTAQNRANSVNLRGWIFFTRWNVPRYIILGNSCFFMSQDGRQWRSCGRFQQIKANNLCSIPIVEDESHNCDYNQPHLPK